ncbi:TetR/AcrR family transcriptional regulator [Leifsonia sp. 2MCAF36]|uniref:TetR/AcrR family transcriptional regulator n=1 Tax=Leifsonia sp. 2MCAF36 TaxID=3232988 RepID=UPI003F9573BC
MRNRQKITEVAAEAFAIRGLSVSVAEIARAAAVSTGTVSRHFPTKSELVAEVLGERVQNLLIMTDASSAVGDPVSMLETFFTAMVDAGASHRGLGDMLEGRGDPEVGRSLHELGEQLIRDRIAHLLALAQQSGAVRADVSATAIIQFAIACILIGREAGEPARRVAEDVILSGLRTS